MTWRPYERQRFSIPPSSWTVATVLVVAILACLSGLPTLGSGQQSRESTPQDVDRPSADDGDMQRHEIGSLYREGTDFTDAAGRFIITGDRVEFRASNGEESFLVLENLALQRVQNEVFKLGAGVRWDVKGILTEYQGRNYLLLRRAVIASSFEQN